MARLPEPQVLGAGEDTGPWPQPLTIGLVGSGRAASTLGHSLERAGHHLLLAHRGPAAVELAAELGASMSGAAEVLANADVTILAVPDSAVAEVAAKLADGAPDGGGRLVAHLSGSQGRDVLEPLAARGYATAAIHPLQVLSGRRLAPSTAFAVEAAGAARVVAVRLVEDMRGFEIALPASGRAGYHAAAVIAANLAMTMLAEAVDLLERQGTPRAEALTGLVSLVRGGLEATIDLGLPAALTGPVTRGDVDTVARHLEVLADDPDLRRAYAACSLLTRRQARRDHRPADETVDRRLRHILEEAL